MRERWAQVTNEALREAGVAARVDHRSYKAQGIDREPQARIPQSVLYSERSSGRSTPAGDDIRARHRERVEARLKGGEELARVIERQKAENRQRAIQSAERKNANKKIPYGALTREEVNQRRRETYKANAEELNRKQREYRKRHVEQDSARRWAKFRQQQLERKPAQEHDPARQNAAALGGPTTSPTAEESVKNWLAYRESQRRAPASPTAEESVKNWLAYRESQRRAPTSPSAEEESVKNWLAYRESQRRAESSHGASQDGSRDPPVGETDRDTEEPGKDTKRGRQDDLGL
jgi:hypothetical protein